MATPSRLLVLAFAWFASLGRHHRHHGAGDHCERAYAARAWAQVIAQCEPGSARVALAQAWSDLLARRGTPAVDAEALLDSEVGADAALLAGYVYGQRDDDTTRARSRVLLRRALDEYLALGRHSDAARAAGYLSRASSQLEDALRYATLATTEAKAAGDVVAAGAALTDLAEVYDDIGMVDDARDTFFEAEEQLRAAPGKLAFTYLKHGIFLVNQDPDQARRAGLAYLQAARDIVLAAPTVDSFTRDRVTYAVRLQAANAFADLGDLAGAEAELSVEPVDEDERRAMMLTRGFLAARADRLDEAERLFVAANADDYDLDTRWWVALELARGYRRAGRVIEAERYFREAIELVEGSRGSGTPARLRPFVLARRAAAYSELVGLLADQGRGVDALVASEALHARTWLDVVLADQPERQQPTARWLQAASIRAREVAQPPLGAAELLARVGEREAIVVLSAGRARWRLHIDHGQVDIVPISTDELDAIARFRQAPDDRDAARRAARALLPADIGERADPLYVVVDRDLEDLPFAALPIDGAPLVMRRPVVRMPGLAVLGCRRQTWTADQIFIGDSVGDLPGAAAEVQRLGGAAAQTGPRATRAAVMAAANAELLHIAVHGRATPGGAALVLADGVVTSADVLDAQVGPHTVMLTGCATSSTADAEGWTGLPSAFLASGSRFVVATLRSVPDDGATALIAAYEATPRDQSPPVRLAAAQRAVVDTLPPRIWAAFAAWGDAGCDR